MQLPSRNDYGTLLWVCIGSTTRRVRALRQRGLGRPYGAVLAPRHRFDS
jgi:hypothetical protein